MAVEIEIQLERVDEEDLDCVVKERDRKEPGVWRKADAQNIFGNLENARLHKLQSLCCPRRAEHRLLHNLEVPEPDSFVGAACNNRLAVRMDLKGPYWAIVMGHDAFHQRRRGHVV